MEYIYSAMLLHSVGKEITEDGIKKVLEAAGTDVDDSRVKALISSLEGVDLEEAMNTAAAMPAAAPAGASAAAAGSGGEAEEKKEEEEEEEEEVSEEDAMAGLGALFG